LSPTRPIRNALHIKKIMKDLQQRARILIVDDEESIRSLVRELLAPDCDCMVAGSVEEASRVLLANTFDLVLSDIDLGDSSGLIMVPQILERSPETVVIMISGQQSIESAIEAMRVGRLTTSRSHSTCVMCRRQLIADWSITGYWQGSGNMRTISRSWCNSGPPRSNTLRSTIA